MRALGGEAEQDGALAEFEARPRGGLREWRRSLRRAEAERHDVDALWRQAEQLEQVIARALGVGDHAMRAPRGGRHEHAHALVADPGVLEPRHLPLLQVQDRGTPGGAQVDRADSFCAERCYLLVQVGRDLVGECGEADHESLTSLPVRAAS